MKQDDAGQLVKAVQLNQRYSRVDGNLVLRLVEREIHKGRDGKEVVKAVRNKLHQIGSSYQESGIPYAKLSQALSSLPGELHSSQIKEFCLTALNCHASTRERVPGMEHFYNSLFAELDPPSQILDAACGLHPLAIPWMPLPANCTYNACDIYGDMVDFINLFLAHIHMPGKAFLCDLTSQIPEVPADTVFLFKTIPVLDQIQPGAVEKLFDSLPARQWVITFPSHSLGGASKGMRENYDRRFQELSQAKPWLIKRLDFSDELVFVVKRS